MTEDDNNPDIQLARADFPTFPEAIFEIWLEECIRRLGWPPVEGSWLAWQGLLLNKTPAFWRDVSWRLETLTLDETALETNSAQLLRELRAHVVTDAPPSLFSWIPPHSRETIGWHKATLRSEGKHIAPPLLLKQGSLFMVVDGHHRLAAAFDMEEAHTHEFWIAEAVHRTECAL